MGSDEPNYSTTEKDLGIMLKSSLNWKDHSSCASRSYLEV